MQALNDALLAAQASHDAFLNLASSSSFARGSAKDEEEAKEEKAEEEDEDPIKAWVAYTTSTLGFLNFGFGFLEATSLQAAARSTATQEASQDGRRGGAPRPSWRAVGCPRARVALAGQRASSQLGDARRHLEGAEVASQLGQVGEPRRSSQELVQCLLCREAGWPRS